MITGTNSTLLKKQVLRSDIDWSPSFELKNILPDNVELFATYNIMGSLARGLGFAKDRIVLALEKGLDSPHTLCLHDFECLYLLPKNHIDSTNNTIVKQLIETKLWRAIIESCSGIHNLVSLISIAKWKLLSHIALCEKINSLKGEVKDDTHILYEYLTMSLKKYLQPENVYNIMLSALSQKFNFDINSPPQNVTVTDDIINNLRIPEKNKVQNWMLWNNVKSAVFKNIDNNINVNNVELPVVASFQEVNIDQLIDLEQYYGNKNYTFISFSNITGEKIDRNANELHYFDPSEGKGKDGLGFINTISFSHHYVLNDSVNSGIRKAWISDTPELPSPTPGGLAHQKHLMLAVHLKNNTTNKSMWYINVHVSWKRGTHKYSYAKIREFINDVTDSGKMPFLLGGDLNSYSDHEPAWQAFDELLHDCNDVRDLSTNHYTSTGTAGTEFYGYPHDMAKTKFNSDANSLEPETLAHILTNKNTSFITPLYMKLSSGAMDSNNNLILEGNSSESLEAVKNNRFASDHGLVVTGFTRKSN